MCRAQLGDSSAPCGIEGFPQGCSARAESQLVPQQAWHTGGQSWKGVCSSLSLPTWSPWGVAGLLTWQRRAPKDHGGRWLGLLETRPQTCLASLLPYVLGQSSPRPAQLKGREMDPTSHGKLGQTIHRRLSLACLLKEMSPFQLNKTASLWGSTDVN